MRKITFLLVVALVFSIVPAGFAAVENVKLSGDITTRGLFRESYGFGGLDNNDTFNGVIFSPTDDDQAFYMSQVRLRVNADLTTKVAGEIELLNQRDWDAPSGAGQGSAAQAGTVVGPGAANGLSATNDQFDVILNLANVTIKELYYPELSVKIGRQDIQWGEGFILGKTQLGNPDPSGTLTADEFTQFTSLDAFRFMVNKDAWHFDAVLAKIQENIVDRADDQNMYGINIGRTFTQYQSEAEAYFIGSEDESVANGIGDIFETTEQLWTIGGRGSLRPWDRLKLSGETAFQWGEEGGAAAGGALGQTSFNGYAQQDISAFAFDFRAEWNWLESPWPATLGTEWVFYSGENDTEDGKSGAWRPLFRGKFHSAIREFQGTFYMTDVPITAGNTNEHELMFDISFHPFNNKDLTFFTRWLMFWLDEIPVAGRGRFVGNEFNTTLNYAYTEDLNFKFIGALLDPGNYFETDADATNAAGQSVVTAGETAKELVAEVTLNF